MRSLQGLYSDHGNFFIVPEMKKEDMREILLSWFAREERTLTKAQTEAAIHALAQCPLPLFLKLTFDWALRHEIRCSSRVRLCLD